MWKYSQETGELRRNGNLVSTIGYSGKGRGKNNPSLQGAAGVGPIPKGRWKMVSMYDSKNVGPRTIMLHAVDVHPTDDIHDPTGRSSFRIHGDSIKSPGTASRGCIILPRVIRERMWNSKDHDLEVVD